MKLKTILENIINKNNLIQTCIEISKQSYQLQRCYDEYVNVLVDLPGNDYKNYLDSLIKEWILKWLNEGNKDIVELYKDLNHFDRKYIDKIINTLASQRKIEYINNSTIELNTIEKKRFKLLNRIQNASEEELDKML